MATYAVGDIQGCLTPLVNLLNRIQFNPHRDKLWVAGDLINRGPESLATLRFIKGLANAATVILGNHDLHLLAVSKGYKKSSSKDTIKEILDAPDRKELLSWLQQQPLMHYDPTLGYAMVHAGIPHLWSIEKALGLAKEIQDCLQSSDSDAFFVEMYGNQPDTWDDNLEGKDRMRAIVNYLTRMRFCDKDGKLDLKTKTGPEDAPSGYAPWFSHKNPHLGQTRVIFGHWASLLGNTGDDQFIGLDTGCVWGRDLTVIRLEDGERYSEGCAL